MRVISWNFNGRFKGRLELLAEYNADVYCIQECESDKYADFQHDGAVHWEVHLQYKGLETFVRRGHASERLLWSSFGACYFLPVRIAAKYDLINVWTQQGYVAEWYVYQQLHKDKFHQNTVLCGDFNSFENNKKTSSGFRTHENCVAQLNELGLFQNENKEPTFFHRYNIDQPFRLDYCFASRVNLKSITIGKPEKWLQYSDHMPLIIDLKD